MKVNRFTALRRVDRCHSVYNSMRIVRACTCLLLYPHSVYARCGVCFISLEASRPRPTTLSILWSDGGHYCILCVKHGVGRPVASGKLREPLQGDLRRRLRPESRRALPAWRGASQQQTTIATAIAVASSDESANDNNNKRQQQQHRNSRYSTPAMTRLSASRRLRICPVRAFSLSMLRRT